MYMFKTVVNLATQASPICNNIALENTKNLICTAKSVAVMQDGYVNIVPLDSSERRSKYIPVSQDNRGSGKATEVKWIEFGKSSFLVILSTFGVQVYDEDCSKCIFQHSCKDTGDDKSYAKGVCVLKSNMLCVGTWLGTVWMFRYEHETKEFKFINRVYAHDEAVVVLDGDEQYMASTSTDMTYFWTARVRDFNIIRKLSVPGLHSIPTTLKYAFGFIILGHRSGEFAIFDSKDEEYLVRVAAHKLQVTSLDFSATFIVLSVSDDCYIKLWKFIQESPEVQPLQTIYNEEGPLYGAGFLSYSATEFAVITGGSAKVSLYARWQQDIDDAITASPEG